VTRSLNASRSTASAPPGRHAGGVGAGDDDAAGGEHLGLQQPLGVAAALAPQAVAAHQFGEAVGAVRRRRADGALLPQVHADAQPSGRQGGVAAGHAGADHGHARIAQGS
jgi:hypothetical protein